MSSASKTLYGILAFLPLLLGILIAVQVFSFISEMVPYIEEHERPDAVLFEHIAPLMMLGLFTGIVSLTSLILYIVHVVNNKKVESGERVMWILLFIFVNGIAEPIYFLIRIVGDKPKEETTLKM